MMRIKRLLNLTSKMIIHFTLACLCLYSLSAHSAALPPNTQANLPPLSVKTAPMSDVKAGNTIQRKFTIKDIVGSNGLLLTGANAIRVLYLPVPQEWTLDDINLQLSIYSSSLFGVPSTLTASVNGNPINAVRLNESFKINSTWNVTIPGALITGNIVNLTFNNVLDDFGNNCYNLTSPKFWLYIAGNSIITYNYHVDDFHPDLTKYPFPYIQNPAIEKSTVVIVLPDKPTLDNYTAAFYLTNSLVNKSTWLGVKIIATTVKGLTNDQKLNNNIIYVGTSEQLHLADMSVKWPLIVSDKIYDANHNEIKDETGVIMLNQSPWNPKKGILVVTGNGEKAVIKAASMLRNPDFINTVLFNQYALITNDNEKINYESTWTETTLADLSFPNQNVYGNGMNAINYDIDLPLDKIIKGLDLSLDYSSSPFLSSKENSYLTVRVNDFPVDGITLKPGKSTIKTWKIRIDGKNLRNGPNRISLVFNLNNQNQHCKQDDASLLWGTIYSSSKLHLLLDNGSVFLNYKILKASPYSLIVSLPSQNTYFQSQDFAQEVVDISKVMPLISSVQFVNNDQFDINDYKDDNIIYMGDIRDNKSLNALLPALPFSFDKSKLFIDPTIKPYVAISNEQPIGMSDMIRSPVNSDRFMMVIMGANDQGYEGIVKLYTDEKRSSLVEGNATLLYENGSFTSIKADKIIDTQNRKKKINKDISYTLAGVVLAAVLLFILRKLYLKLKKYFSPKNE